MLDPTWTATNNPQDAPAIASPRRSRTWAAFLTRNCIVVPPRREDIKLGYNSALRKTFLRLPMPTIEIVHSEGLPLSLFERHRAAIAYLAASSFQAPKVLLKHRDGIREFVSAFC